MKNVRKELLDFLVAQLKEVTPEEGHQQTENLIYGMSEIDLPAAIRAVKKVLANRVTEVKIPTELLSKL